MKKMLICYLLFCLVTFTFAQETDDTYWLRETDVNGNLVTEYMCKTDAQFNNTFKKIVKNQLGIEYEWREPNWNLIKSSFISLEGIKKRFPKTYDSIKEDANFSIDYKYFWVIQDLGGIYVIKLFKRVNGIEYRSITMMSSDYQWAYTQEVLTVLERNFN